MPNYGLQNEVEIIDLLNNKRIKTLPNFWKKFVCCLFPDACLDDYVYCNKAEIHQKEDMVLHVNRDAQTVSIKSGKNVSVHCETLNRFCGFLKWVGISDESIEFLRLYHYGDGTIDGTGERRSGIRELNEQYKEKIEKFNNEVNNKENLFKILLRFLRLGTPNQKSCADYIYYGDVSGGIYCNLYWFIGYLSKKEYGHYDSIHFGPFTYDNDSRDLTFKNTNNDETLDKRRYYCKIKWLTIEEDINEFRKKRFMLAKQSVENKKNEESIHND